MKIKMTVYKISTYIKTDIEPKYIVYDMKLYKIDNKGNIIYALEPTGKQNLQADKRTLFHSSLDLSDPETTSYILELNLFHKVDNEEYELLPEPMTAIIPLKGFLVTEKKWGLSRAFEYDATVEETQKGNKYEHTLKLSSKIRAFETVEYPQGTPQDPFSIEKIEEGLKSRLAKKDYPDQGQSMLCGPAAFFYCLLIDRPDLYKQMVKELWESGVTKIGTLKLQPSVGCRRPKNFFEANTEGMSTRVSAIDWITLASLRDTENSVLDFDSPDNTASGITIAANIKKWFEEAGSKVIHEINTNVLMHLAGSTLTLKQLCHLNSYIAPDTHVVVLITSRMIDAQGPSTKKNHWIVWTDKLKLINGQEVTEQTLSTELVQLECFSWGVVKNSLLKNTTLADVIKYSYAAVVVSKIP